MRNYKKYILRQFPWYYVCLTVADNFMSLIKINLKSKVRKQNFKYKNTEQINKLRQKIKSLEQFAVVYILCVNRALMM